MGRRFETGQDLIDHVKHMINEELLISTTLKGKPRLGIIYMEIPDKTIVWSYLYKIGIKVEGHIKNKYFVYLV